MLRPGMLIRIVNHAGDKEAHNSYYADCHFGSVIKVKDGECGGHASETFPDQQCFRSFCQLEWREVKKPTIIIG